MNHRYSNILPLMTGAALVLAGAFAFHGSHADASTSHDVQPEIQYLHPASSTAPFSQAVRVGNLLYLSGQIGMTHEGALPADFAQQAHQTMENVGEVLHSAGSDFDQVFKCTAMLSDMSHWQEFNRVYVTYFKPGRLPARSAIGANGLAYGAMIELECIAYSPPK